MTTQHNTTKGKTTGTTTETYWASQHQKLFPARVPRGDLLIMEQKNVCVTQDVVTVVVTVGVVGVADVGGMW